VRSKKKTDPLTVALILSGKFKELSPKEMMDRHSIKFNKGQRIAELTLDIPEGWDIYDPVVRGLLGNVLDGVYTLVLKRGKT
jgi:hypothetical protein